jgi:hypothetical protein
VLFSKRDPSTRRFKLWYAEAGRPPAPLDEADRAVPFDADLGPGAIAVYSRCRVEPRWDPLVENRRSRGSRAAG